MGKTAGIITKMRHTTHALEAAIEALDSACLISVGRQAFAVFYRGDIHIVLGLNSSAHAFAKLVKSGVPAKEINANYASELGIPEEISEDFIELISEDWQNLGAIGPDLFLTVPPLCEASEAPDPTTADYDASVCIGGDNVRVVLHDPELAALTSPMIDHPIHSGAAPRLTIRAWQHKNVWHILTGDGQLEALKDIENARDRILTLLMQNSWPELVDAPCVHGATLRSPSGRHLMLSGDSGRGKTTLALGLGKHSFTLLSDDMSVFDAEREMLMPMMMNPSVKQGAWQPLESFYPELEGQSPIRIKGRLCKYIRRHHVHPREHLHGIDALVFPKWRQGADATLSPFDDQEALLSMLRCSYLPNNQDNLQTMADFLARMPLYELTYSDFRQADRLLLDLLECKS